MDLSHLASLSPSEYEKERCRIIGEFLDSLPKERRNQMLLLQLRIDEKRDTMTAEEFQKWLAYEMGESIENLSDLFVSIMNNVHPR